MNSKSNRMRMILRWASVATTLVMLSWVGQAQEFTSFSKLENITINEQGAATPFPSIINVTDGQGIVEEVKVTLNNFTASFPDDVDVLLVFERAELKDSNGNVTQAKRRRGVVLMSDAGGQIAVNKIGLTFDQDAGGSLPDNTQLASGTFKPTNHDKPAGSTELNDNEHTNEANVNTAFGLTGANAIDELTANLNDITKFGDNGTQGHDGKGAWRLYVFDDREVGTGSIGGGWTLELQGTPVIGNIDNQTFDEDSSKTVNFTVSDNGSTGSVVLFVSSSNTGLIPNGNLVQGGSGSSRSLTITPKPDANGTAVITVRAVDGPVTGNNNTPTGNTQEVTRTFNVTVTAKNDAPTITAISNQTTTIGQVVGPIRFTIGDGGAENNETAATLADLNLAVTSSADGIIPDGTSNVHFVDAGGGKYDMFLGPEGVATGTTEITLTITDNATGFGGGDNKSANTKFNFTVNGVSERAFASNTAITADGDSGVTFANATQDLLGASAKAGKVIVTLRDVVLSNPENVKVELVSPANDVVVLMDDVGGNNAIDFTYLTFNDSADKDDPNSNDASDRLPNTLPDTDKIANGTFVPTFGNGAAPQPRLADLGITDLNGQWKLRVTGLQGGDQIRGGFTLIIQEGPIFTNVEDDDGQIANGIDQVINEDNQLVVPFIVADNDTNVNDLTVSATSNNQAAIKDGSITFNTQDGSNRSLIVSPESNFNGGPVTITLKVTDGFGDSAGTATFALTINAVNDAPTIDFIDRQITRDGATVGPVPFIVRDVDLIGNTPNTLTITATSSNDKIIPNDASHIVITKNTANSQTGVNGDQFEITLFPVPQGNKSDDTSTLIEVKVTDNGNLVGTQTFPLTVRPSQSILTVNQSEITIRDNNTAQPFPSQVNVANVSGVIESATITIAGFNHNDPQDVEMMVVGPTGAGVILMSNVGGVNNVGAALSGNQGGDNGIQVTFDDTAANSLPGTQLASGTFKPTNAGAITTVGQGAPTGSFLNNTLGVFQGLNPNGNWALYIRDKSAQTANPTDHFGRVAQGWSVNLITRPVVSGLPDTLTISEDVQHTEKITVGDNQGASDDFQVTVTSSDQNLIANGDISVSKVSGSPGERSIAFKSVANANSGTGNTPNTVTLTVTVTDAGGNNPQSDTVVVTITPVNDAPVIDFTNPDKLDEDGFTTLAGCATPAFAFTVTDVETAAGDLAVSASAADASIIDSLLITRNGAAGTIQVIPNGISSGRTAITLTVTPKNESASTTISFTLTIDGSAVSAFQNKSPITINDNTSATPYPSTISISGLVGEISDVKLVLDDVTHGFPEDMDIVLQAPNGKKVLVLSDAGGNTGISNVRLEIDDQAAAPLTGAQIQSGSYKVSNIGAGDALPSIGSTFDDEMADFIGLDPNGVWSLFVSDDTPPDSGTIGAWYLVLKTGPAITISDLNSTGFIRNDKGNTDASDDEKFVGTITDEDTAIDVGFTVGDSDTDPNSLTISVDAYNVGDFRAFIEGGPALANPATTATLIPRTFQKNSDGNFVKVGGGTTTTPETNGIRTDMVVSGTGSKRSVRINTGSNLNTNGEAKKGGSGTNKDDLIDPNNDVPQSVVRITVTDGTRTVTKDFVLEVNRVNDAPSLASIVGLPDSNILEVNEDGTLTVNFTIDDLEDSPDGTPFAGAAATTRDRLTLSLLSSNNSILKADGDNNSNGFAFVDDGDGFLNTRRVTLDPQDNANGDVVISLVVTDDTPGKQLTGTKDFTLRVKSVNDAPLIGQKNNNGAIVDGTIGNVTVKVGETKTVAFSVTDLETDDGALTLQFGSANTQLLPSSSFVITKSTNGDREVTITPAGLLTGTVAVTFTVKDANGGTKAATFNVDVVDSIGETFTQAGRITIFDNSAASPYPSTINVPGATHGGDVREVTITLNNITHTNPDDLDIIVTHGGKTVALMSDAGGSGDLPKTRLKFDDDASLGLPDEGQIGFGVFDPTNFEGSETLPGSAPAPGNSGFGNALSVFNGTNPTGDWQLFVSDDTDNDLVGEVQDGWSLSIVTAPTITSPGNITITEDVQDTKVITVKNQGADSTKLKLSGSSNNTSLIPNNKITFGAIDPATGAVSVNLTSAQDANSGSNGNNKATITLTVLDEISGESQSVSYEVTVTPVNDEPRVLGLPRNVVSINEEAKISIPFTVNDVETDNGSLKVTATSSNTGLIEPVAANITGSGSDRSISINPKGNTVGTADITITVEDTSNPALTNANQTNTPGADNSKLFRVQVNAVNDQPTISAATTTPSTGSGTPVTVKITVDDAESGAANLTLSATSSDTNLVPQSDAALAFGALAANNNAFDSNFTITPVAEKEGTVDITVTVKDGGNNTASVVLTLTVRPSTNRIFVNDDNGDGVFGDTITVNDNTSATPYPSTIAVSGLVGPVKRVSVTLNDVEHNFPGDLDILMVAPNGNNIVLTSDNGSSGRLDKADLTFDDSGASLAGNNNIGSGVFKPRNNNSQAGDIDNFPAPAPINAVTNETDPTLGGKFNGIDGNGTWSLFVVDDAGGDTGTITSGWSLSIQTGPTISDAADFSFAEDSNGKLTFTVNDQDTPLADLQVTATSNNQNLLPNGGLTVAVDSGTRVLTLVPVANANGTAEVTLVVTDQDGHTATAKVNVTVTPANDAPVISGLASAVSIPANTASNVTLTATDGETADGSLVVTVESTDSTLLPAGSVTVANSNGAITLGVTPVGTGATTVTVSVSDGTDITKASFDLSVIPAVTSMFSNADVITINDNSAASPYPSTIEVAGRAGTINKVTVTIETLSHAFVSDVDMLLMGPDGQSVLLMSDVGGTRSASSVTLTFDDSASASLPTTSQISSGTFKPTDGDGGQSSQDNVFPTPAPQDPLAFKSALSAFNGISPNGTWSLFVADDTGADSGTIGSWKLTLTTLAPLLSGLNDTATDEDTPVTVNFDLSGGNTSSLEVSATSSNTDLVANDGLQISGNSLTITPTGNASGTSTITVTVIDGPKGDPQTNSFDESFVLTVNPVNDAPSITQVADVSTNEDTSVVVGITIEDLDTSPEALTITASSSDEAVVANDGLAVAGTGSSRSLTVTPVADASGTSTITVEVSDGELTATTTFVVTVNPVNDPPTIVGIDAAISGTEDTSVVLEFTLADNDSPIGDLTVTALSLSDQIVPNDGLELIGRSGLRGLTITPAPNANGVANLRLTVRDDVNSTRFNFSVDFASVNDVPVVAAIPDATVKAGESIDIPISVTDEDSDASNISVGTVSLTTATIPNEALSVSDSTVADDGSINFTLTVAPGATVTPGDASVRVTVFDESQFVRNTFTVTVTPAGPKLAMIDEIPATPGTGLQGRYWQLAPRSIENILDRGGAKDIGLRTIRTVPPTATFTSSAINYTGGNDLTPLQEWLGPDAASLNGGTAANNMNEGLMSFTGFIRVPVAGTFDFRSESDDGSVLWVAGTKVIDNDGSHGSPGDNPDGQYTFDSPGLYPIELAYFNGEWTDADGNHGGAEVVLLSNVPAGDVAPAATGLVPVGGGNLFGPQDLPDVGAPIPAGEIADSPEEVGTGLTGTYFQSPPGSVLNLKNLGGEGDIGLDIIRNGFPAGRFISTGINYSGNDLTPIAEWLGDDGASYRGIDGNLDDGVFSFSGLINITEPGEVSFRSESDDGSIVWIAGQKVIDNDGSHGSPGDNPDGKAFFPRSGLYPIEVAYFNGDWTDADGNHGGAGISLLSNGEVISGDVLYRADNTISLANADVGTGLTDEDPDNNDPAAPGSATISSPFTDVFDVDVTAGGGDIWGEADRGHFVYTDWTGDFDASVQVTKLDPINRWSKAGINIRESIAEDSRMVYVNVDADNVPTVDNPDAEGADRYEMGVRVETAGGTGNWAANGGEAIVGDLELEFPAWIRVTRIGNTFTAYRGDDGVNWTKMSSIDQDYPEAVVLALATTSHNNGGVDFVTNAEYRNFTIGSVPSGPAEPPVVDISFADGQVTVTWDRGNLQSAPSVTGEWTDVTLIPGRGQPPLPAQSPFTSNVTRPTLFFRAVD